MNLGPCYDGGFFAGGILKEHRQFGSWIGFSLAKGEPVTIKPTDYTGTQTPLQMRIEKEIPNSDRLLVDDWALRTPGQTVTTKALDPGFYVISVLSQPETLTGTFFGLDIYFRWRRGWVVRFSAWVNGVWGVLFGLAADDGFSIDV